MKKVSKLGVIEYSDLIVWNSGVVSLGSYGGALSGRAHSKVFPTGMRHWTDDDGEHHTRARTTPRRSWSVSPRRGLNHAHFIAAKARSGK